ncbi:MAG TPA: HNH endonuclease signature motif containing protein [Dehalococcoidales bacterium]|nr:HNH endonuclease signature motif containing protein [Dehalococcoidales bacterium]
MNNNYTYTDENGYLRYSDSNYLVHRRIKEKEIGRRLVKGEIVHHKNGNKQDNKPENLELLTAKEHYKKHVVPILEERREAKINEKVTPVIASKVIRSFCFGFIIAGAIFFISGNIIPGSIDLRWLGVIILLAGFFPLLYQLRRK